MPEILTEKDLPTKSDYIKRVKINSPWMYYNKEKENNKKFKNRKQLTVITTNLNRPIFTINKNDRFYGFENKENIDTEKKIKKKNPIRKLIFNNLDNYFDKSTLHGLRYVGDNTLTLGERIFWLLSFLTAIAFAAYFINIIYAKFNNSPVIISFSPTVVSVSEIPFPAITICSVNVVKKKEGERILKSGTDTERILLDDYCHTNYTAGKTSEDIDDVGDWETLKSFILNVTQSCPEMLKMCEWKQKEKNCNDIFNAILTDDGYCCTFNRLPLSYIFRNLKELNDLNETYPKYVHDWTPEKGYNSSVSLEALPLRSAGAGAHLGLTVILDAQVDSYYCTTTSSIGFKVLLSNPIETPKMADFGFFVRPGIEARIVVKPRKVDSTATLQSIDIVKRQCFFPRERYLQLYRTYTERNCKSECQANKTLGLCNCVPYFLPKNRTARICGKKHEVCVQKVKAQLEKPSLTPECNCLPSCFELSYEKSNSYNTISVKAKLRDDVLKSDSLEYFSENVAIVHFYYNENSFNKRIKSEIYGFSEFLSNTGGLLGLFLGFSFLSAVEIGYYIVIKTLVKLFKRHQNKNKIKNVVQSDDKDTIYPFLK
ncbi:pickpocket protein 28-like [Onthophagus taurus]|uniref:pickpocket protein 28-like n=1 Tax=Onthophagus taurus TaxID=166361 RepID=UPI0039BDBCB4